MWVYMGFILFHGEKFECSSKYGSTDLTKHFKNYITSCLA